MRRSAATFAGVIAVAGVAAFAWGGAFDTPGAARAATCAACHGANGNSRSASMPILAGLSPDYFKKTMQDYASGTRPSAEMGPFAKAVIATGALDDLATFFAAQPREATPGRPDRAAIARGRDAAGPCVACHGASGVGDASRGAPALAGQAPGYLKNQMILFKTGGRGAGDPEVAKAKAALVPLSEQTLGDLAAYYAGLGR